MLFNPPKKNHLLFKLITQTKYGIEVVSLIQVTFSKQILLLEYIVIWKTESLPYLSNSVILTYSEINFVKFL